MITTCKIGCYYAKHLDRYKVGKSRKFTNAKWKVLCHDIIRLSCIPMYVDTIYTNRKVFFTEKERLFTLFTFTWKSFYQRNISSTSFQTI